MRRGTAFAWHGGVLLLVLTIAGCTAKPAFSVKVAGGGPEATGDGSMTLRGIYEGELADSQTLVVVRERDSQFYPPAAAEIDSETRTWIQRNLDLREPGRWTLHVCTMQASELASLSQSPVGQTERQLQAAAQELENVSIFIQGTSYARVEPVAPVSPKAPSEQGGTRAPPTSVAVQPKVIPKPRTPQPPADVAPQLGDPDQIAQNDKLLIRFDQSLTILGRLHRFGVFRNIEGRDVQWINETLGSVEAPQGNTISALNLHYEVPTRDSYNGWWLKLQEANWTAYDGWSIVLRIRAGEPCTRKFKIELKTTAAPDEPYPYGVSITDRQFQAMQQDGFIDLAVPIRTIVGRQTDLSSMLEFVIVFENSLVDPKIGDLLIHSIRLAPPAEDVSQIDPKSVIADLANKALSWFEATPDTSRFQAA